MFETTPKKKWNQHNQTDKNLDFKFSDATAYFGGKF
jgi:hypothetical protein